MVKKRRQYLRDPETGKRSRNDSLEDRKFRGIHIRIPRHAHDLIEAKAKETGLPKSRLIAYAVYNELQTGNPFNFLTGPPKDYETSKYDLAGERLVQILKKERYGVPKDMLIMSAGMYSMTGEEMRGAIQNVIDRGRVKLLTNNASSYFNWPSDYVWLCLAHHKTKTIDDLEIFERRKGKNALAKLGPL